MKSTQDLEDVQLAPTPTHSFLSRSLNSGSQDLLVLLKDITNKPGSDYRHPKLRLVVEEIVRRWRQGEKSLLFCFRVPTAEVLYKLVGERVRKELARARRSLFEARGTEGERDGEAMQQFRRSLTARDGSGVPLFLDRVLFCWLDANKIAFPELTESDLDSIADLCARAEYAGSLLFPTYLRPDRVFLHRATEHVLGKRLLADGIKDVDGLLGQISSEEWIRFRYGEWGLQPGLTDEGERPEYRARSSLSARFELTPVGDEKIKRTILAGLKSRPRSKRTSVLDTIVSGPNLLLPRGEAEQRLDDAARQRCRTLRELVMQVSRSSSGWNWTKRAQVLDALVRAFLREDILLRLPASVFKGADETWTESLLRGLHEPGEYQREPLASRMERFLQEIVEMGEDELMAYLRYAMDPHAESVALVTGSNGANRDAIFNGFNTPLLPDVLICTAVGQEGIDLHRQCRHIVHYDLDWNPAKVEQRTGRVDRIGSKAERERTLYAQGQTLSEDQLPGLDVGLPYLAGTYDERMFERLRTLAQICEIVTGGDPTADAEAVDILVDPSLAENLDFVPLPDGMLKDLRIDLSVSRLGPLNRLGS